MKNLSERQVLNAISESGGIITTIARRLKCNWNTARTYCNKWESTKQALQDETESNIDLAEQVILDAIRGGELNTCKWYLSTKGKHRGYTTDIKDDPQNAAGTDAPILKLVMDYNDKEVDYDGYMDYCKEKGIDTERRTMEKDPHIEVFAG